MKFKYISIFIITVLSILYIITIIEVKKQNNFFSFLTEKYSMNEKELYMYKNIIVHLIEKNSKYEINSEGRNEKGEIVKLSQIVEQDSLWLIFKYKISDCSSCIDSTYNKLKKLSINKKLLIISDFPNFSSIKHIKKYYNLENVYFLKTEIPEEIITPCVYCLDNKLRISNFLYIDVNDNILRPYINCINNQ